MYPNRSITTLLLAATFTAGTWYFGTETADAADCGCSSPHHCCLGVKHDRCGCECSSWLEDNCLKRAFASVGKMFCFGSDGGCDEGGCDDACDAAMVQELMMTEPLHHQYPPIYETPAPIQSMPMQMSPSYQPQPVQPSRPQNMNRPMSPRLPEPIERVNPPVRVPEPQPVEEPDSGSLFDTLSDPFEDDEAKVEGLRAIRPSSYRSSAFRSDRGYSSRRAARNSR